jgi:hypothetical protein
MQKLPVLIAVKHALMAIVSFRANGMRIGVLWMLVLAALKALDFAFLGGTILSDDAPGQAMEIRQTDIAFAIVSTIAVSSIAVNWHRFILRDEITPPEKIFRLDALVWRYVGRFALITLVVFVPLVAISIAIVSLDPAAKYLLIVPVVIAAVYMMRMWISLPAIAVDRRDFNIVAALNATAGNNLRFAGVLVLNFLIFFLTAFVFGVFVKAAGNVSPVFMKVTAVVLSVPANLFLTLFSLSLLSSMYGFFAEQRKF